MKLRWTLDKEVRSDPLVATKSAMCYNDKYSGLQTKYKIKIKN